MSRLSDDEKRVFTDRIAELEKERDDFRNGFHLAEVKVMSRETIIKQLSETELAKDVTRLEAEVYYEDEEGRGVRYKDWCEQLTEENTLLAEHNQALRHDLTGWLQLARRQYKEMAHNESICPTLNGINATETILNIELTGGDDAN